MTGWSTRSLNSCAGVTDDDLVAALRWLQTVCVGIDEAHRLGHRPDTGTAGAVDDAASAFYRAFSGGRPPAQVAALAHLATLLSEYMTTRSGPTCAATEWDTVAGFFAGLAASHAHHGGDVEARGHALDEVEASYQAIEEVTNQVYTIDYAALGVVVPESVRANLHRSASAVEQHVLRRSCENPLDSHEVELLQGLVAGRSISDLATDFGYSERSISRSLRSIWDRVGATSRAEGIATITANGWLHAHGAGDTSPLSADDRRLLRLLVSGRTVEEIANYLDVSTRTIHRRLQHIWDEIGATSRSEGIAIVSTRGWLEPQPSTTSD